jgi:hypothetical protein
VKAFGSGDTEELGGKFYAINVACPDDAMDEQLAQAPTKLVVSEAARRYEKCQGT